MRVSARCLGFATMNEGPHVGGCSGHRTRPKAIRARVKVPSPNQPRAQVLVGAGSAHCLVMEVVA